MKVWPAWVGSHGPARLLMTSRDPFFFIPTFLHFDPVILRIYLFINETGASELRRVKMLPSAFFSWISALRGDLMKVSAPA